MNISPEWILRFEAKVKKGLDGECWIWTASASLKGYGQIKIPKTRRQIPAHRLSYLIHVGSIPEGKCVLHRCDVPACVNPAHLFLGTKMDNALDMVSKMRHCYGERQGSHKLTEKEVLDIFKLLKLGVKQKQIASMFSVGEMQISRIKRGQRWKHVFNRI